MAQRYIYLSEELNAKLKEEKNASGLIQGLLKEYYEIEKEKSEFSHLTLEEKKKMLEILKKKEEMEKQIEEIKNG